MEPRNVAQGSMSPSVVQLFQVNHGSLIILHVANIFVGGDHMQTVPTMSYSATLSAFHTLLRAMG